eukprot:scaffold14595_cov68-Phaeocystis_antarctica.AAC.4
MWCERAAATWACCACTVAGVAAAATSALMRRGPQELLCVPKLRVGAREPQLAVVVGRARALVLVVSAATLVVERGVQGGVDGVAPASSDGWLLVCCVVEARARRAERQVLELVGARCCTWVDLLDGLVDAGEGALLQQPRGAVESEPCDGRASRAAAAGRVAVVTVVVTTSAVGIDLAEHGHAASADPCWEGVLRLRRVDLTLEAGQHLLHDGAAVGAIEERRQGGSDLAFIDSVAAPRCVALVVLWIADEQRGSARVVVQAERASAGVVHVAVARVGFERCVGHLEHAESEPLVRGEARQLCRLGRLEAERLEAAVGLHAVEQVVAELLHVLMAARRAREDLGVSLAADLVAAVGGWRASKHVVLVEPVPPGEIDDERTGHPVPPAALLARHV